LGQYQSIADVDTFKELLLPYLPHLGPGKKKKTFLKGQEFREYAKKHLYT